MRIIAMSLLDSPPVEVSSHIPNAMVAGRPLRAVMMAHAIWKLGQPGGARADLTGGTFNELKLAQADFSRAILRSTNWIHTELVGTVFAGAMLEQADFRQAMLADADLAGADLAGANCSGAWLRQANLSECTLTAVNFKKTRMEGARLLETKVHECDFTQAELVATGWHQARIFRGIFSDCALDSALFYGVKMQFCRFVGAIGKGVNFSNAVVPLVIFLSDSTLVLSLLKSNVCLINMRAKVTTGSGSPIL